jgi:hypothetical protein
MLVAWIPAQAEKREKAPEGRTPAADAGGFPAQVTVERIENSQMSKAEKWTDKDGAVCFVVAATSAGSPAISCLKK